MSACPTIETENLILRPFKDEDTNDFFSMMDSREVREALHVSDDYGLSEAFHAMSAWLGQWELRGTGHWALEEITERLNKVRSPFRTAEAFLVEEIIEPAKTRPLLCEFANLAAPLRGGSSSGFGYRP